MNTTKSARENGTARKGLKRSENKAVKKAVWKKSIDVARKMLKKGVYSEEEIAELTGLELAEVQL